MRPLASYARRAALGLTLLLAALLAVRHFDPLTPGLTATYFRDAEFTSTPATIRTEDVPSTDNLESAWPDGRVPDTFSATWAGSILAVRSGRYTFATESDDGSWLYVDGRLVVDNGGRHERRRQTGTIDLDRGVHEIFIKYFQDGGQMAMAVEWSYGAGALEPVPDWALSVRHSEFARTLATVIVRHAVVVIALVWTFAVAAAFLLTAAPPTCTWLQRSLDDPYRRTLTYIVAGSTLLDAAALWWGLPSAWVGDEVVPRLVYEALLAHYSGGWFNRYPPLLFYVLSLVDGPVLLLRSSGWLPLSPVAEEVTLFVLGRLVSVLAAAGTLVAVYACGVRAFGRRAGVAAAAALALLAPFVFYAKAANPEIPYTFWFALSLFFCVRAIETRSGRDIGLLVLTAAAAVATKDQAYALYLPMPFVLVWAIWRSNRERGIAAPFARALFDRRLWGAALAGLLLFSVIQNLPLNWHGFVSHVRDITGPGRGYGVFEPTLRGQWSLLALTADLDRRSWGWPLFLVSWFGLAIALRSRAQRRFVIVLALVAASYYAAFIAVLLYDYDRYLLPIGVVQALWCGVAIDWFLDRGAIAAGWRRGLVVAVFAYSVLYAATVDVLMLRDSRYTAERWLDAHAGRSQLVGTMFPLVVLPRMRDFSWVDIGTADNLERWKPAYFVLNADYARAVAPESGPAAVAAGLQQHTLAYHLAFRIRTASPWPWLPGGHPDLVGPRLDVPVFSFLRDINPTIEIYARD